MAKSADSKISPERVAMVLGGKLRILSNKELEESYRIGGNLPRHAEFTVKLPKGWEIAQPWEGPEINDDGTITLFLEEKERR